MIYNDLRYSRLGSKASGKCIFIAYLKKAICAIKNGFVNHSYNKETDEMPTQTKVARLKIGSLAT